MSYEDVYREVHGHLPPLPKEVPEKHSKSRRFSKRAIALIAILVLGSLTGIAYAVKTYTYHVNPLIVPETKEIVLYQSDGLTIIPDTHNISSSLWVWNAGRFEFTFLIMNNGNVPVQPSVSLTLPESWEVQIDDINSLGVGTGQYVNITCTPPSNIPGYSSGYFDLAITIT